MKNIYTSLTENNGEEGILKGLVDENEIQDLLANPFNISGNNIKVRKRTNGACTQFRFSLKVIYFIKLLRYFFNKRLCYTING